MLGWLAAIGLGAGAHMGGMFFSGAYRGAVAGLEGSIRKGLTGKGFSSLKANVGFGFKALKSNPKGIMGVGSLRGMSGAARNMPVGRGMGEAISKHASQWWRAADYAGHPNLQRTAMWARRGAAIGALPAAGMAADFLNPWGLGWGD